MKIRCNEYTVEAVDTFSQFNDRYGEKVKIDGDYVVGTKRALWALAIYCIGSCSASSVTSEDVTFAMNSGYSMAMCLRGECYG